MTAPRDAEYEALVEGVGLLDPEAGTFVARGPDAVEYLQGQVAADISSLSIGQGAECLVLTPRGGLVAVTTAYRIVDHEVLFVCDAPAATAAVEALNRFRIRVDVTIEEQLDAAVWHLVGPRAYDATDETFGVVPSMPLGTVHVDVDDGIRLAACADGGLGGLYVVGPSEKPEITGSVEVGRSAVDMRRVELGVPVFGVDFDEGTIPHEAGLVPRAVSLTKGCYVGQELVERVHTRGNPARLLRRVRLADAEVPSVGSEVVHDGKVVGTLTTTAFCPGWGSPGGLGLLKRTVEAGDRVTVGDKAGTVL